MTTKRRGISARRAMTIALATAAAAGPALGLAGTAQAANMPDWASDFDAAGDAFEGGGGGGGGGGGTWRPMPLHPDTASGGAGVPTVCTIRPTPTGEEQVCTPVYPAGSLPPANPGPGSGMTTGSGGKGLGDRDGGSDVVYPPRDVEGQRLVADWERLLALWGAALGSGDKPEAARLSEEMNRVAERLTARRWTRQMDPAKPRYLEWVPPLNCC